MPSPVIAWSSVTSKLVKNDLQEQIFQEVWYKLCHSCSSKKDQVLWVQEWLFLYLLLIKLWVGRWNPDFFVENLEVMTERHDQVDGQSAPLKSAWRIISQMSEIEFVRFSSASQAIFSCYVCSSWTSDSLGPSDSLRCSIPFLEQGFEYTQVGTLRWGWPLWLVGWHLFPWFRDDQVSAGGLHTVLLRNDGNALCVGNNRCLWWFWYGWINMTICTYFYEDLDVEDAWWIFDVSLRCKWGVLFSFGRRIHILKSQLKTSA